MITSKSLMMLLRSRIILYRRQQRKRMPKLMLLQPNAMPFSKRWRKIAILVLKSTIESALLRSKLWLETETTK